MRERQIFTLTVIGLQEADTSNSIEDGLPMKGYVWKYKASEAE
jgi:hypothetical protein